MLSWVSAQNCTRLADLNRKSPFTTEKMGFQGVMILQWGMDPILGPVFPGALRRNPSFLRAQSSALDATDYFLSIWYNFQGSICNKAECQMPNNAQDTSNSHSFASLCTIQNHPNALFRLRVNFGQQKPQLRPNLDPHVSDSGPTWLQHSASWRFVSGWSSKQFSIKFWTVSWQLMKPVNAYSPKNVHLPCQ